ncbi:GNAT family N-acetyltransferase [Fuscovulum blasticum]|uniref:GNAT family N-acetyltransferase n=1 Tax=Fuscovulum blasticum TaxID=1075 RepID=UPI000D50563F|nr:GNAT family N-acetyltransferase [Fuscovulum blasticum]AWD22397.1 GNAT family N-acetyltransferase [Fuscovulum blasticum]
MTPYQCLAPFDWSALLTLIQTEFAFMEGRIDPPSSMHRLTAAAIAEQAAQAEVWAIGTPPIACVFLTAKPGALYIGKLAVAAPHRGQGLARHLIDLAERRARALGLPALELQTRVELVENQATFRALGFVETGRTAHTGYAQPTSVTFRRPLAPTV